MQTDNTNQSNSWEQKLLGQLATDILDEQKRKRRWGIFFKLLAFAYFGFFLWVLANGPGGGNVKKASSYTAVVELKGAIDSDGGASAQRIVEGLRAAFEDTKTVGIILRINSPGGSPVQSGIIYDEIVRLRSQYPKTPLYAVIEDVCASGGYYVASATDRIYVNKASLVGSIGVLMDGFGFDQAIKKLGVERRLLTAGENKGFLDPFSPLSNSQAQHASDMLKEIHEQFIAAVKQGRGERLKLETPGLFSGLIWNGAKSIQIGLTDEFGTVDSVARDVLKAEELVDFTQHDSVADRLFKRVGVGLGEGAINSLSRLLQVH